MRMWMVDPKLMCRKHLLGEHLECHMFAGALVKGKSIAGYINKNLCEPLSIQKRHDELAKEMEDRGYQHSSPILGFEELSTKLPPEQRDYRIDRKISSKELFKRCKECREKKMGRRK